MRIASLPMYNIPEIRPALSDLWWGLAQYMRLEGLQDVPDRLVFDRPLASLWSNPSLLFSQCCGYDVVNRYMDILAPVAVPKFDVPGCAGHEYSSLIVVPEESPFDDVLEMRGTLAVINGPESHSGMGALRHLVAPRNENGRFFQQVKVSGSHAESLKLLRAGEADVAAIDCVTHTLFATYQPNAIAGTRVLGGTYHAPAPPYVARVDDGPEAARRIRNAILRTFGDTDFAAARHALYLKGIEEVDVDVYRKVADYEAQSAQLGFPVLQ